MMHSYPGTDPDIASWKGQEIIEFQEDLLNRVNGQLSEKWFYTHMKGSNEALPRIDVLNLLSKYAGYSNWQDFRYKNMSRIPVAGKPGKPLNILIRIPLLFLVVMTVLLIIFKIFNTQSYRFTFIDSDTGELILNNNIRAELLTGADSPVYYMSDSIGRITVRTNKSSLSMIVRTQYYLTDTIRRTLRKFKHNEQISLTADYYALMISYFSQSDVNSWEKRREQLARILSEDAIIYQFPDKNAGEGMALYTKWEFIDKITMPTSGLRHIEIVDCRYINDKIILLRFRNKTKNDEMD